MRWLVELKGEIFDLEDLPSWFPDGDSFVLREGKQFYLTAPVLEGFSQSTDVYNAALQLIDEFYGIGLLMTPSLRKPTIGTIFREDDKGNRKPHQIVQLTGIESRTKVGSPRASVNGQVPKQETRPTEAQKLLKGARKDVHLKTAIMLWADPPRSWPRLYRILEEIEASLGHKVNGERERFTHSANHADVAGKDSRHRRGKYEPPRHPMSLNEADAFIARVLKAACN